MNRPIYRSFDDYAKVYPDAERFRVWITNIFVPNGNRKLNAREKEWSKRGPRPVVLIPCSPDFCGLPGDYFWICTTTYSAKWCVHVHDCDDGLTTKECTTEAEAQQTIEDLIALAPFALGDLDSFGFKR